MPHSVSPNSSPPREDAAVPNAPAEAPNGVLEESASSGAEDVPDASKGASEAAGPSLEDMFDEDSSDEEFFSSAPNRATNAESASQQVLCVQSIMIKAERADLYQKACTGDEVR